MTTLFRWICLVGAAALSGCAPDGSANGEPENGVGSAVGESVAASEPAAGMRIREAIAGIEGRDAEEAARDANRKPAAVLAFLGAEPGMTVLDIFAAGGWYSEVLSAVVGSDGRVIAQNPPRLLQVRDGIFDKQLTARLEGGRLSNVERVDAGLSELGLPAGSVDMALTALNVHDMYHMMSPDAAHSVFRQTYDLLRPGGVFGVIDHAGATGVNNAELHRIDPDAVRKMAEEAGFVLEAESDVLRNPDDDLTRPVFDPEVRGRTDRFVLRLRKPAGQ